MLRFRSAGIWHLRVLIFKEQRLSFPSSVITRIIKVNGRMNYVLYFSVFCHICHERRTHYVRSLLLILKLKQVRIFIESATSRCHQNAFQRILTELFQRRKRAFSVAKCNIPTSTNYFTKTRKFWWSRFLEPNFHNFVDFEKNLHKTLTELVEAISWSLRNYSLRSSISFEKS